MNHDRADDMPPYLRWIMTFINRVGFPVLVCMWLAYQQFVGAKETIKAIQDFKEILIGMKETLDKQNRILLRRAKDD